MIWSSREQSIRRLTNLRVDRVDIRHDIGHSISPAVDIGQIEGGMCRAWAG